MQRLWQSIYRASNGTMGGADARRIANLCLALRSQRGAGEIDKSRFFSEIVRIGKFLGGPISIKPKLGSEIWRLLTAYDWQAPSREQTDGWIEAFQAADSARKSLGAYATPAVFSDVLARETLKPFLAARTPLRIVDPAAGTGNLLLAAHRCLVGAGYDPRESAYSLYGVELDPAARELCVLLLWTASGLEPADLERIADNIQLANAITFDWRKLGPFDALLMNPPWESLRHARSDPAQSKVRADTLARLARPEAGSEGLPPLYSAQGRGDRNLFKLFVELAPHLLRKDGRFGAVLPAAFGSDDGMGALRQFYLAHLALDCWTSFENRAKYFQIDSRYKFGLLTGTRDAEGTAALNVRSFCTHPRDVEAPHVRLGRAELGTIGGDDHMIPELVAPQERDVLARMLASGTPFFEAGPLGTVRYRREVDLTMGRRAKRFWHIEEGSASQGERLSFGHKNEIVPVLEGRMIGQYDCFQKSWVSGEGRRAVWERNGDLPLSACRPQFVTFARERSDTRVAICDVTSATNTRTVLAALVPPTWTCGNTAPVLAFGTVEYALAGLAVLNSMVFDWFARRMVGGLHLNKFYLARLTWPRFAPREVARLSELGRAAATLHPRGAVASSTSENAASLVPILAEIEVLTARGYGLDRGLLGAIFANDRGDRRGLWRYFASSAASQEVVALALAALSQPPDPGVILAA